MDKEDIVTVYYNLLLENTAANGKILVERNGKKEEVDYLEEMAGQLEEVISDLMEHGSDGIELHRKLRRKLDADSEIQKAKDKTLGFWAAMRSLNKKHNINFYSALLDEHFKYVVDVVTPTLHTEEQFLKALYTFHDPKDKWWLSKVVGDKFNAKVYVVDANGVTDKLFMPELFEFYDPENFEELRVKTMQYYTKLYNHFYPLFDDPSKKNSMSNSKRPKYAKRLFDDDQSDEESIFGCMVI